ncbi:MAG: hypothetical protein AAGM27_11325 [Cyanobacteria bacterium J06554_3]
MTSDITTFSTSFQPWTARYAKLVAVVLAYGATVHIGNIAGLSGTPWLATPLLWRCMDIALLVFDIVAAVSLWKELGWSVWFVFSGIILLQFVPYTLLRFSFGEATPSHFILKPQDAQTLNGLLGTEAILLALFLILLLAKK